MKIFQTTEMGTTLRHRRREERAQTLKQVAQNGCRISTVRGI